MVHCEFLLPTATGSARQKSYMGTGKMASSSGSTYAKSHPGLLKLGQFGFLLCAFVVLAYYNSFYEKYHDPSVRVERTDRFTFFYTVTIMLWIFVIIIYVVCFAGLNAKIIDTWNVMMIILDILAATMLLVASSLITDEITNLQHFEAQTPSGATTEVNYCDLMDEQPDKPKCGHLRGVAACGFLAMVLFLADIVAHYMRMRFPQLFGASSNGRQQAPVRNSDIEMCQVST